MPFRSTAHILWYNVSKKLRSPTGGRFFNAIIMQFESNMTHRTESKSYMPEPPKTVRELSIAIALRDENINLQLQAINTNILKLTESVQQLSSSKADKDDLRELDGRVKLLEDDYRSITKRIAGYAIMAVVMMVLAQYGLTKFIK